MPQYPAHLYTQFVSRAQAAGSGLGKSRHLDGSLKALAALLRQDSTSMLITAAIAALARMPDPGHSNKLRKYREAVAFLENTFPIAPAMRQAPTGMGIEAIRYVRNPTPPSASFVNGHVNYHTLRLSPALAQIGQDMTVPDYMEANAANTRVVLIHLGGAQSDMAFAWDGLPALEHMNAVLRTAAECHMHVCILCDPHERGRGVGVPTPANAVCAGLRDAVGQIPGTHVWVADGGAAHSAFHDPAYAAWVSDPSVRNVVVMGFDADVCVRGNVFGIAEVMADAIPQRVVPALINHADVVTSRPLLSGGDAGTITAFESWGSLCYTRHD